MIFPDVRLSELKADVELKRKSLQKSSRGFKTAFTDLSRPVTFLKKNPWALIGSITSALVAFKAFKGLFLKRGILGKLASFGGALFANKVLPLATDGVLMGLNALYKKANKARKNGRGA